MSFDKEIAAGIEWIFPPHADPAPCPRCGKLPTLQSNNCISWFECKNRWWGLRRCHSGPIVMEGAEDAVYAHNAAARAWNRYVERLAQG